MPSNKKTPTQEPGIVRAKGGALAAKGAGGWLEGLGDRTITRIVAAVLETSTVIGLVASIKEHWSTWIMCVLAGATALFVFGHSRRIVKALESRREELGEDESESEPRGEPRRTTKSPGETEALLHAISDALTSQPDAIGLLRDMRERISGVEFRVSQALTERDQRLNRLLGSYWNGDSQVRPEDALNAGVNAKVSVDGLRLDVFGSKDIKAPGMINELQAHIDSSKKEIADLKERVRELESRGIGAFAAGCDRVVSVEYADRMFVVEGTAAAVELQRRIPCVISALHEDTITGTTATEPQTDYTAVAVEAASSCTRITVKQPIINDGRKYVYVSY